jgi:hypothetical protein
MSPRIGARDHLAETGHPALVQLPTELNKCRVHRCAPATAVKTSLAPQALTPDRVVYARTDVGGAYRWDSGASKWVGLMDWISEP